MAHDRWRSEDEWPEDKAGPEYSMHKEQNESSKPPKRIRFSVIQISAAANDLVCDLEQALLRLCKADKEESSGQVVAEVYALLNQRRKEIYQYLASLEFNAGIRREVTRRFD